MDVSERRQRTSDILDHYESMRSRFGEREIRGMSHATLTHLEALLRETIRLLRENLADCVRSERRAAERSGGERRHRPSTIDLGLSEVKAELDDAIQRLTAEKVAVRSAKLNTDNDVRVAVDEKPVPHNGAEDRLMKLVALHTSGVLTAEEFAAAKARLV